jgi:hypothetical protein
VRRLPTPAEEPFPSRADAVLEGFAQYAATHERTLMDVAKAFAKKGSRDS